MSQATLSKSRPQSTAAHVADSFSRSVLLISFLMLLQRAIGFARSFYVCGSLPPEEVGRWDLAFGFLVLAAPLSVLGIPGSFGRYLARYEQLGQQSRLLRSAVVACIASTLLAASMIFIFRESISDRFFGESADSSPLVLLAFGLPIVALFNFWTSWFTGKRLNRFVFRIQFTQTLFFALLCLVMFRLVEVSANSVVIAYLLSCLIGTVLGAGYVAASDPSNALEDSASPLEPIWRVILPFAVWVWASNLLMNLFAVCDRLLLVNFHPTTDQGVQFLIGQYHTACLFPLLLTTFGAMVAATGLPYLSSDWESGDRESVSRRMNLMLVLLGVVCLVASVGVLLIAPILFDQIWKGKFAIGEALLPMTLCYCSLAAMSLVSQKFFWCIERAWVSTVFVLIGVVVNFVIGLLLISRFGLDGVVASTLVSHAVVLAGVLMLCRRNGMKVEPGVIVIVIALCLIGFGKLFAMIAFIVIVALALLTPILFCEEDKQAIVERMKHLTERLRTKSA